MTPIQQQKFNTIVGGVFIGAGVLAWLITVFFSVMPNEKAPAPVTMEPHVNMVSCQAAMAQLGYQTTLKVSDLELYEPFGSDVQAQFEKASIAWSLCQVPVREFCAGEGCEKPGISMTLKGPVGKPRPAAAPAEGASKAKPSAESKPAAASKK